ncbi:hypothetical protein F5Y15DRAFT_158184 [Xylariaceae sp. FL0016]|nr:hypothetical protein F5Y15DRAFT_158184 [Xylariaceae sp. FL0016]
MFPHVVSASICRDASQIARAIARAARPPAIFEPPTLGAAAGVSLEEAPELDAESVPLLEFTVLVAVLDTTTVVLPLSLALVALPDGKLVWIVRPLPELVSIVSEPLVVVVATVSVEVSEKEVMTVRGGDSVGNVTLVSVVAVSDGMLMVQGATMQLVVVASAVGSTVSVCAAAARARTRTASEMGMRAGAMLDVMVRQQQNSVQRDNVCV